MERIAHQRVAILPCEEQQRTIVISTIQPLRVSYVTFIWMTFIIQQTQSISLSKYLKNLHLLWGFNLTKWSSNSLETNTSMPQDDQNPNDTKQSAMLPPIPKQGEKDKQISTTDTEKVLGKPWSVSRDSFVINREHLKSCSRERHLAKKFGECFIDLGPNWFFCALQLAIKNNHAGHLAFRKTMGQPFIQQFWCNPYRNQKFF